MSVEKIRVGIIGVHPDKGWATIAHIPALRLLSDFKITTISNHQPEAAKMAAKKFDIANAVETTEELVGHPEVDLVVITVKVPRHLELVGMAINAGKSVLCEWPLGIDLDEAIKMRDLAKSRGVFAAVGLQTRAAPAINFVRDLIDDGYVGVVRSVSVIASGILWGEAMNAAFQYTLDPNSGAGMLPVTFGHTIDAILYALRSKFASLSATLTSVRKTTRIIETGVDAAMYVPDQIGLSGLLTNGSFLNAHFRGGLSQGTNFHWEINGSAGDLVVTTPVAYIGAGGYQVRGAQGDETLRGLEIPGMYGDDRFEPGIPQSIAIAYERLASDMRLGTHLVPDFEEAALLHGLLAEITQSGGAHHA
jgi:predicted dehydrogenase